MSDLRDVRQHHAALTEIARRRGRIDRADCWTEATSTQPDTLYIQEDGRAVKIFAIVQEAPDNMVRDSAHALRLALEFNAVVAQVDALLRLVVTRFYRG
jgi:hypothetical protein